ncbi:MAG: hypothetical protein L0G81_08380 [Ewingella sp.]|nr:hypothetical protein [Ewingella sp.]
MAKTLQALDGWLKLETWHTWHPLDEARFHQAVYKVLSVNGPHNVTPDDIIAYIHQEYSHKLDPKFLSDKSMDAAAKFELLSEFVAVNRL